MKHAPIWHRLQYRRMCKSSLEVLGHTISARTLKAAYSEVVSVIESIGELPDQCKACGSLLPKHIDRCWACGRTLPPCDHVDDLVELKNHAFELGVEDFDSLGPIELKREVAAAERRMKDACDRDLLEIEPIKLNEYLTEQLPSGWRKRQSSHYTSYYDRSNTKRITVPYRGLRIQFAVEDGFFKGVREMKFSDAQDRKRLHMGRSNYMYMGDIFQEIVDHCEKIFETYTEEKKTETKKKTQTKKKTGKKRG